MLSSDTVGIERAYVEQWMRIRNDTSPEHRTPPDTIKETTMSVYGTMSTERLFIELDVAEREAKADEYVPAWRENAKQRVSMIERELDRRELVEGRLLS